MATVADSLKNSTININNISKSLVETKRSVSTVNDSVSNISKIIATNTRVKRELFATSEIINSRRKEASKRQELEDQIETSNVSTNPTSGLAFAGRSEKGPLGRLLGFLGFTFAGWIVENLPTWIFMGKEFVSRIEMFGRSMNNMVGSMRMIIESFGTVLKTSFDSIVRLDFNEFSDGSVTQSFDELNLAVKGLGDDITETFKLFTTPLNQSVETGEEAPALDEDRPETMFPPTNQSSTTQSAISRVSGIHKQALDIISGPESGGNYNAMNQGTDKNGNIVGSTMGGKTSKDIIGKNLTDMTIGEVMDRQNERKYPRNARPDLGIHAAGKYQIIGITLPGAMKGAGLKPSDKFSPENQDLLGLAVLKSRGIGAWTSGGSTYDAKETAIIKQAQRTPVTFTPSTPQAPPPSPTPSIPVNPMVGDRLGAGRNHGGVDLQVKEGTPLRAISDGTIVDSDFEKNWGNFLVMKDNLGIYHLYGHMQSGYKRGGPVKKGEIIGKVGMTGRTTGPHLHWEAGTGWNRSVITGRFDALTKYSKFAPFNTQASKDSKTETPAQITPQPKPSQPASMTPERKGSQVMIIDHTQPQVPQVPYAQASQSTVTPTVHESKLLNNFIKNKLLLDLAYL